MPNYYGHMNWGSGVGWLLVALIITALVVHILDRWPTRQARVDPLEHLEHRLAAGEVSLEEYQRIRDALSA